MGKKRPKSRTTKPPSVQSTPRDSSASEPLDDDSSPTFYTTPQMPEVKVCRLCETKDGPFLNIFDADTVTAKKIEEVMPFTIAENDDLPNKICFRCSAKVEELYEFIQKCIKTQQNLRTTIGKRCYPPVTKTKTRVLWEEKLNKTNLSNEDICNALIKKAMEGIKDIPLNPLPLEEERAQPPVSKKTRSSIEPRSSIESTSTPKIDMEPPLISSKNNISYQSDDEPEEVTLKHVKLAIEKCDKSPLTRTLRGNKSENLLDGVVEPAKKLKQYPSRKSQNKTEPSLADNKPTSNKINDTKQSEDQKIGAVSNAKNKDKSDVEKPKVLPAKIQEAPPPPPINIMDHVSTIKVNGVGTLFLCKLCNRNFLKKEVVMTHGCAKNNVPKDNFMQNHVPPPEVPKPPTVKYIKMDKDFKKPVTTESILAPEPKPVEKKAAPSDAVRLTSVQPEATFKVRAGPSSKVKSQARPAELPKEPTPPPSKSSDKTVIPDVQFPGLPSLNSRYKLVPGPNNTFTLIEDSTAQTGDKSTEGNNTEVSKTKNKKRKAMIGINDSKVGAKPLKSSVSQEESPVGAEVIDVDDNILPGPTVMEQPYPVGLFQTVPHHSGVFAPNNHPQPPAFTTPAMKKQSYTIVQTGNPSKLLISTKAQPIAEEPAKKKSRKSKLEERDINKEPFNVTIEENAPPKDTSFFTFINVDPLLQPSYVLPTANIIQESQISTSTPASKGILDNKEKEKYVCNMCDEKFSREKKLLTHIQSHYKQMDEEDEMRSEKTGSKKKSRKT